MADSPRGFEDVALPEEPIHRLMKPLTRFLHIEAASGAVLLACAVIAIVLANSPLSESFRAFWKTEVGFSWGAFELHHSLKHWINDGLMVVFFFVIGLEVKREIVLGELRDFGSATLPIAGAMGGMLLPAGLYLLLQSASPGQRGWGIPMATDIAFVVGCMAVLGSRIPATLRVMLLSLAIVDDIGAILVIAFGYTDALNVSWLIVGMLAIGFIVVMQRLGVRSIAMYTVIGFFSWFGFHESGIHATIAGVIIGLLTPARPYLEQTLAGDLLRRAADFIHGDPWHTVTNRSARVRQYLQTARETISPLEYLIDQLHPWVAFVIMPVFALANAGVELQWKDLVSPVALSVTVALSLGKPLGIVAVCWTAIQLKITSLPTSITWRHLIGAGCLAGVGFTMALFISDLAFDDPTILSSAKVGVLLSSVLSAVLGMTILMTTPQKEDAEFQSSTDENEIA